MSLRFLLQSACNSSASRSLPIPNALVAPPKTFCLTSFTTTADFGNCVVVSQGAANVAAASRLRMVTIKVLPRRMVHQKDDTSKENALSKRGDASKMTAPPKKAQPKTKVPPKTKGPPKPQAPPKQVVPPEKPAPPTGKNTSPKKDNKKKGNTHKRNCKCQPRCI